MDTPSAHASSHIWEDMLINERRLKSAQLGKRISDWEEENSLLEAIKESLENVDESIIPIDNKVMTVPDHIQSHSENSKSVTKNNDQNNDSLSQSNQNEELSADIGIIQVNFSVSLSYSNPVSDNVADEEESIWMRLPYELSQRILIILGDIDMCGYLLQVAKYHPFKPSEVVYRSICESIFNRQTFKRKIQIDRWKLWRNMAIYRPRLRTNGFYCLRTLYTRAPCNDNFWEERRTEFIEVKFYRHMRFYNDGYMLYSMDILDPWDMCKLLESGSPIYKRIYEGHYTLTGNDLTVEVMLHYCIMRFKMKVLDGDDGYIGKHNMLTIVEHSSIPLNVQQRQEQQLLEQANQTQSNNIRSNRRSRPLRHAIQESPPTLSLVNNEAHRVFYPLSSSSSLRFFRHWNWVP